MSAELVPCPQCSRKNNAMRPTCIYCGAALPVVEEISAEMMARAAAPRNRDNKLDLDPLSQISAQLQQSILSFNIILMPITEAQIDRAMQALISQGGYNDTEARQLLKMVRPVPLARYQHEVEARAVFEQLKNNLPIKLISDEKLQTSTPNQRSRRLSINPLDGITLTINPENLAEAPMVLPANEIKLIVEGKIRYRQYEATEENKGFGKTDRELTNAVEYGDETPIVDIYTSSLDTSFRVRAESFDYSGLGTKMKLTTLENFRMLITVLCEVAKSAIYDADYKNCYKLLEPVWPSLRRNQSLGLRRAKMLTAGKIATRSVYHIDNEVQFNRYSRLSYYLMSEPQS